MLPVQLFEMAILSWDFGLPLHLVFCQTPGLGLGVDFTFAPLHISPATLAHLPGNLCTSPRQPKPTPKVRKVS